MIFQTHRLENDLQILLVPGHSVQSVSVGVFVTAGSRYEPDSLAGAAHFIEHMLFKGTRRRPTAREIAEAVEGVGGYSNAYTDQETTAYEVKVSAAHLDTALDVLVDQVRNSLFAPAEFEKERRVIGEELDMVYDAPDEWIVVLTDRLLWPNHPLGRSVAGTRESLNGMTRDALVDFYHSLYQPRSVVVAIAGAFYPADVLPRLSGLLSDWKPQTRPAFRPAPPVQTEPRWVVEQRPIEQGHLCLALPALPRSHPDRYTLSVLNAVLGDGMSSRLFQSIREERGLAYAIDSHLTFLSDTGALEIYAGVDPDRAAETVQIILDELKRLVDEPVPEAELNRFREYLKGRLVLSLEDTFNQASWVAYQAMFLDDIRTPEQVLSAYDAVTPEAVQSLARQILRSNRLNLAAVGPFSNPDALTRLVARASI
ncbi:MAG: insulinase family protein [Chloroflexi bacterium]|nr:MAG: insulinase family protein [Chloroflexota bacterium]